MSNFLESIHYQFPLDQVREDVKYEMLVAQLKNPNGWRSDYFYNFHLNFPYEKDGRKFEAANLANARAMGDEHMQHCELYGEAGGRHTEVFLESTPFQIDQLRVLIATDLGYYDENYLAVVSDFIRFKDAKIKNYEIIRQKREAMFFKLEPFWIGYRAVGFTANDLKS